MIAMDPFSQYYAELLDDTYDVIDRLVLNAYFPLALSQGGFRTWWRQLHGGSDETLDDTHLMRMAGRFARRVRGWAKKYNIPVIYCAAGERKHDVALKHLPTDPRFRGVFAVLVGRAPAPVWEVLRSERGGLHMRRKTPMPWVSHYYFNIVDAEWGHVTIKICGHPPFSAQIMLNGHEYTACQARRRSIGFTKEGNCFTEVSDSAGLARVADTLRSPTAVGRLRHVCERWIYQCVCFGLSYDEQHNSGFRYQYSIYQLEYSRNLLFKRGGKMDQVFAGAIDRTRAALDIKTVKTIFGHKHRPWRMDKSRPHRAEVVLERPVYDLTVFKVHFGNLTLKVYTKGERVLRIEAIAHDTRELRCGRRVDKFPDMVTILAEMLGRFLQALRCIDVTWVSDGILDALPTPSVVGNTRVGGVDINKPRMRAAMGAVVALAPSPHGFTTATHARKVQALLDQSNRVYTPRQAAYDLRKLRAKGLVRQVAPRSRHYEPTPDGLRTMAGLVVLRDKIIVPLLAGCGRRTLGRKPTNRGEFDVHYEAVQREMQHLFTAMRIAA